MKFKKFLIIILSVALLSCFAVSTFATDATTAATISDYGFYVSPGEYVFDEDPTPGYGINLLFRFNFTRLNSDTVLLALYFYPDDSTMLYAYGLPVSTGYSYYAFFEDSWQNDDFRYITVLDGFYIYDIDVYQWWQSNLTRVSPGYNSSFFDNMLSIFTVIGQWISGAAANLTSMFFVDNSLTFVGTLTIAALAMAVVFLIIGLISRFLRFKA